MFGGEKKLKAAVKEAYELFKPRAICDLLDLPGGTDRRRRVHAVARESRSASRSRVFHWERANILCKGASRLGGPITSACARARASVDNRDGATAADILL